MKNMIVFEKQYTLNMIGKLLKVGDITPLGSGESACVIGITKVEIDEVYVNVEGYGILTDC